MAQPGQENSHEKVKAAKSAFAICLQATASLTHYIQMHLRECPVRRVDREVGLNPFREAQAKSIFIWSVFRGSWTRKDGGMLVAEGEIWVAIRYLRNDTSQASTIEIYNKLLEQVEGVDHGDVQKVWMLWKDGGLSRDRVEFSRDVRMDEWTNGIRWRS